MTKKSGDSFEPKKFPHDFSKPKKPKSLKKPKGLHKFPETPKGV